jgi:hypothetical protein
VRQILPRVTFFLFEANEAHEGWLAKTGERYFIVVLSSEETLVEFYGTGGSGDSYYREQRRTTTVSSRDVSGRPRSIG